MHSSRLATWVMATRPSWERQEEILTQGSTRHSTDNTSTGRGELRFLPYNPWVWIWVCLHWRLGGRSCRTLPRCCLRWRLSLVRQCPHTQSRPGGSLRYSVGWWTCKCGCYSCAVVYYYTSLTNNNIRAGIRKVPELRYILFTWDSTISDFLNLKDQFIFLWFINEIPHNPKVLRCLMN